MTTGLLVVVALLCGFAAGWIHLGLLGSAVERALNAGSPRPLVLSAPLRTLIPAGTVVALGTFGVPSLLGALAGVILAQRIAVRWLGEERA